MKNKLESLKKCLYRPSHVGPMSPLLSKPLQSKFSRSTKAINSKSAVPNSGKCDIHCTELTEITQQEENLRGNHLQVDLTDEVKLPCILKCHYSLSWITSMGFYHDLQGGKTASPKPVINYIPWGYVQAKTTHPKAEKTSLTLFDSDKVFIQGAASYKKVGHSGDQK